MANCPEPANPDQPPIDSAYWDRSTADLVADGHDLVVIWSVKNSMIALGCTLDFPPPTYSNNGWHHIDTSPTGV